MIVRYDVGDVVKMKKTHPCGGMEWQIYRTGIDFGITCLTCGRKVMVPRVKFEKAVKTIVRKAVQEE